MKILLTGGGTGGHFWPLIAVAEELQKQREQEKILSFKLYYMADTEYNKNALFENQIEYIYVPAGKMRLYSSVKNFADIFSTAFGCIIGLCKIFILYPDVIFSKGGYASFPAMFAAKILRIPVIIHESDTVPGRVNIWASKFAYRIAISYPESAKYFPKDKVAHIGQPIRQNLIQKSKEGSDTYFKIDPNIPTILIIGGSQGAQTINDTFVDILPEIIKTYQVLHQTGELLYKETVDRVSVVLNESEFKNRYHAFADLSTSDLKYAAGAATLVISRAGSMIFEIANWGIPSIIIPIRPEISRDQTSNAFSYARTGAAIVIEENNLTSSILLHEIKHLMENKTLLQSMSEKTSKIGKADAAKVIAEELIKVGLEHEK